MKRQSSTKCYSQKTHKYIDKTAIFYILTYFAFRCIEYPVGVHRFSDSRRMRNVGLSLQIFVESCTLKPRTFEPVNGCDAPLLFQDSVE